METQKKTCTACKVICVCCFCGIGAYLIQTGRSYQRNSKLLINLLGIGSIGLGIGEIFDLSPIRSNTKDNP